MTLKSNRSQQSAKNYVNSKLSLSFMMRFLTHLVGDIHQPLHATSLVNKRFPKGDNGGNAFMIDNSSKNLHNYWDQILKGVKDIHAPLNDEDYQYITSKRDKLMKNYPRSMFKEELQETSF